MREHASQLAFGDDVQDAPRHRDHRVLRVAAGREGVRSRLVDDEDPWRRQASCLGDAADDAVEVRRVGFGHRFCAREGERNPVAEPPREF